jgi:hypothetical protein
MTCWSADYYKAKIILKDGKALEGYATLPMNTVLNNTVKYKTNKKSKKKKIKNKKISRAYYYIDGKEYLFERSRMTLSFKSTENNHKGSYQMIGGEYWAFAVTRNPALNTYYVANRYYMDEEGEMYAKITQSLTILDSIYVLFKRPNEDYPFIITTYFNGANRMFRKQTIKYFANDPALVTRIKNKEFKSFDFDKLAEIYIQNQ